eukprot:CAMPEP_0172678886 /NCGR_PEP_ID=MMETSP1074-20121228/15689_1 /TAXON_ID=2916 /ORGANISM="Ceratium fusus, Strain PA161109" /LENGTH=37 /DNA_ID= /DNA_START= /DNA_END= /DNA_ORIENTATION=
MNHRWSVPLLASTELLPAWSPPAACLLLPAAAAAAAA